MRFLGKETKVWEDKTYIFKNYEEITNVLLELGYDSNQYIYFDKE